MAEKLSTTPASGVEVPKVLPAAPEYITGKYVTEYIAACSAEVQKRFKDLCASRRIEIANDSSILKTEQVELFMDAI